MDFIRKLPSDQLIFIAINIFILLLGFGMRYVKGRTIRLLYSLIPGIIFQYLLYGSSCIHLVVSFIVNLYIMRKFQREKLGKISLLYNFIHNSLIHLIRILFQEASWKIEISSIFMMNTLKFTAFAISFSNYVKPNLNKEQERYKIKDYSVLEIASYISFFPTSICGPFMEYNDFINFIEEKNEYASIPYTYYRSLKRFLEAIILAIVNFALGNYGNPEKVIDSNGNYNIFQRCLFFYLSWFSLYKYFSGFSFCEAGILASGFAYEGKTVNENGKEIEGLDRARAIDFFKVSTIYCPSFFFRYWNISVHFWLKRYLYTSLLPDNANNNQKQVAASKTFFVSAFWHGFNLTYFVTFTHFFFLNYLENQIRLIWKNLTKETQEKLEKMKAKKVSAIILNTLMFPYLCLLWQSLEINTLLRLMKATYCIGSLAIFVPNILCSLYINFFMKKIHQYSSDKKSE